MLFHNVSIRHVVQSDQIISFALVKVCQFFMCDFLVIFFSMHALRDTLKIVTRNMFVYVNGSQAFDNFVIFNAVSRLHKFRSILSK